MKRAMLFLIASVAIATVMAQQVPNRSFEDWSAPTFDGNIQPADWNANNVEQFGMKFNFAHRDSGRTGYCMMVQDQDVGFAGITEIYPGYVSLGSPWLYMPSLTAVNQKVYGVSGGIDWTYRPDTMVVWIKRTGSNAAYEDFHLLYYAWRGTAQGSEYKNLSGNCTQYSVTDEESDIRQALDANACTTDSYASQVAEGWFREKATYNDWTQIKVPIYYFNDSLPEKMNILLSASNYPNFRASSGFYAGNSLYVDDVELIYSSRIQRLYIDGREWTAFDPDATGVQEYELPAGTTELPTNIVAVRGAGSLTNSADSTVTFPGRTLSGNEIQISHGLLNGTPTTLTVTAADGSSTTTYQIRFVTNDQPTTIAVSTAEELSNAFLTAASGSAIQLMSDIQMTSTLWLGTETMYEASRSLTLDLNGYSLVRTNGNYRLIDLTHGELIITSSDEQVGGMIVDQASGSSIADLIYVTGSTLKDVNPRTATNGYFSHLVIDMSVTIVAQQNAITVDRVGAATGHNIQYGTDVYYRATSSQYMSIANGVRVDVYGIIDAQKYGVKSNGFLYAPTADGETLWTTNTGEQYADYQVEYGDTAYVPFIHIHESAMISTSSTTFGTTALYASGYARWCIEGNCLGNVGLYIKSGEAEIVNGRIESTNTEFVSVSSPQYSGISSGGSAIVIESTAIGNGQVSLIMRGDNAFVSAESGYAIEEVISSSQETYVREISLYGGTLQAGEAGLIQLNTATLEAGVFYIDEENVNIVEREQEPEIPSGTCGDSLTWEFTLADSTLTITGSGAMTDYNAAGTDAPWAEYRSHIYYIELPEGLTTIGAFAFQNCSAAYTLVIPDNVTLINTGAFTGCSYLHYVTIPEGVTSIGNMAFSDCRSLRELTLPSTTTYIGKYAFTECASISKITCYATTPPSTGQDVVFSGMSYSIPVYVPQASISAYRAAEYWNSFTNYQAIPCSTPYEFTETFNLCGALTFTWHGTVYTESGVYVDTLQSVEGCDSICILELNMPPVYYFTEESEVCEGDTFQWHGRTLTKSGIYTDSLTTIDGCDSIYTLQLRVNPKYLIEDIVSVREDKLPYTWQGETITQSGDYRKEYIASTGCDSVHTLHFTVTALPIYTVNVVADHGRVNGTGTYPEGTRIYLTAVPDEGFEFQMWSDGGVTNPKEFVVTRDTTLRALFYMPEVEQEVVVDSIETNSVTITWDTVPGATLYELRIFKNGELVVTLQVDKDNNIIDASFAGPERIIARKDSTGGSSETLQVNVGGLEPGQDYTYSLDALDDDRSYVGAQSGTFTTEEEPVDRLDALFDDRRTAPRKLLRDGRLYIEMPDGRLYDARGRLIE